MNRDIELSNGWCHGLVDRGRIDFSLGDGLDGERGEHVTVRLTPEEARRIGGLLIAAAAVSERAADGARLSVEEVKP
jgi:hypothetical protein